MATNDVFKRLVDAGVSFTQMTQQKAEAIVREMQQSGSIRVDDAQATVQELIDRGRESTENLVRVGQREVTLQLEALGVDVKSLEQRVEELAARVGLRPHAPAPHAAPSRAAATPTATPAKEAAPKKAAAKKSTAKKSTAK